MASQQIVARQQICMETSAQWEVNTKTLQLASKCGSEVEAEGKEMDEKVNQ
jgi:hypothetical protein